MSAVRLLIPASLSKRRRYTVRAPSSDPLTPEPKNSNNRQAHNRERRSQYCRSQPKPQTIKHVWCKKSGKKSRRATSREQSCRESLSRVLNLCVDQKERNTTSVNIASSG